MRAAGLLLACAVAVAVTCTLALAHPVSAYAEDDGSAQLTNVNSQEDNVVDPTQRADNSFIYDTTIEDLISEPAINDGRTVQVVGEAIGDCIKADVRGKTYWVMVKTTEPGDESSISVLMTASQVKQIDRFGRYGVTGTTVQVRGTFNQACDNHEGLVDIHATSVGVLQHGVDHPDELNLTEFGPGFILILIGAALMAAFYFARERMR